MSSLIARASGECTQYSSSIQAWENIQPKFQDTYQTKGGPENQQLPVANEKSALNPIEPRIKLPIKHSPFQTSNRVVHISRHLISWTRQTILIPVISRWSMQTELSRQFYKCYGTLQKPQLTFPLRSSFQTLFSLGASTTHSRQHLKRILHLLPTLYSFQAKFKCGQQNSKHRRRYGGATPGVGLRRGCDQSKHTFNYYSAEHIWGSMAQGFTKIGGCSAYGGSTPCPKLPLFKVREP